MAPANRNLPVCLRPEVVPLLLYPMVSNPLPEPAERSFATDCSHEFLSGCSRRQRIYKVLHDSILMDVVLCGKPAESGIRAFNQSLQLPIVNSGDRLIGQEDGLACLGVIEVLELLAADSIALITCDSLIFIANPSPAHRPQHLLYFFPLPQGQGSFLPILTALGTDTWASSSA